MSQALLDEIEATRAPRAGVGARGFKIRRPSPAPQPIGRASLRLESGRFRGCPQGETIGEPAEVQGWENAASDEGRAKPLLWGLSQEGLLDPGARRPRPTKGSFWK